MPLTILWGEQNRWQDVEVGRRLASLVPNATLRLLPDAGHFSMLDCPGLFARELDAALAPLTGSGVVHAA